MCMSGTVDAEPCNSLTHDAGVSGECPDSATPTGASHYSCYLTSVSDSTCEYAVGDSTSP